MANLSIRNIEDEIVEALRRKAKLRNRSLEAEIRDILARAAMRLEPAEMRKRAEEIAAMTPKGPQTDSTKLIREDRRR